MIADAVLLLERRIVLFVDDDEREPRQRREHRESRAEDEIGLARCSRAPMPQPFAGRKPAVHRHRPSAGQRFRDALRELRRQVDLRHEDQHLPAGGDAFARGGEIDLGLAATGDALQQERRERSARFADRRDRMLLVDGERCGGTRIGERGPSRGGVRRRRLDPAGFAASDARRA